NPSIAQQIEFRPFGAEPLEKCLQITPPPFVQPATALRQLRYVEAYAKDLRTQSIVIEGRYIDRDYIKAPSVFYCKSLPPYPNPCRRVHFFSVGPAEVKQRLGDIVATGIRAGEAAYHEACLRFSQGAYLGFAVIKPLAGSPVGRTVLRCFPE